MEPVNIVIGVSLLFYAFFSGMEVAFVSAGRFHFLHEDKQPGFLDSVLKIFYEKPTRFIYTLLVGNILSLIVYGILTTRELSSIMDHVAFVVLFQIVVTGSVLFIATFISKLFFRINPDLSIRIFAIPALIFYYLFYPVVTVFAGLSYLLFKILKTDIRKEYYRSDSGRGFLDYFIQHSIDELSEDSEMETEVKLFQNALDFSTIKLRNCIVPRTEIVAVDMTESIETLKALFVETGLSKIIVCNDDIDNIVGYIHSSEMFNTSGNWTESVNQIPIVPDTMAAHKLMNILMQGKKSIAVVVDEFGGTAGIVTLEDLVEEIFGDIEDEHDPQSYLAKKIRKNEYIFAGRNEVNKINEQFDLDLPESDEYITVAGLILEHYQKFPKLNEEIQIGKYLFKVVRLTSTKIDLVKMTVPE
ncbi:MAG: hemolysin family protein [Candidatus Azobacteroides sp.]|nr:hemolysin family protein [Candidatus Azobacteroides sp.]